MKARGRAKALSEAFANAVRIVCPDYSEPDRLDRNNTRPDFYLPSVNTALELKSLAVELEAVKTASDRLQAAKKEQFTVFGTVHISLDGDEAQSFSRRMTGQLLKSIGKASEQLNGCDEHEYAMKGMVIFAEVADLGKIEWNSRYRPSLDMIRNVVNEGMRDNEVGIDAYFVFTINDSNMVNVDAMRRNYLNREYEREFSEFMQLLGKVARRMPYQFLNS